MRSVLASDACAPRSISTRSSWPSSSGGSRPSESPWEPWCPSCWPARWRWARNEFRARSTGRPHRWMHCSTSTIATRCGLCWTKADVRDRRCEHLGVRLQRGRRRVLPRARTGGEPPCWAVPDDTVLARAAVLLAHRHPSQDLRSTAASRKGDGRDRPGAGIDLGPGCRGGHHLLGRLSLARHWAGHSWRCLLYTSDAADEEDSV